MDATALFVLLASALTAYFAYRFGREAFALWSEGRAELVDSGAVFAFKAGLVAPGNKTAYYVAGLQKNGYPVRAFWLGQAAQSMTTIPPETASHEEVVTAAVQGIGYDLAMSLPLDCFRVSPRGRELIVYSTDAERFYQGLCRSRVWRSVLWSIFWLIATTILVAYYFAR